jgi:hypothetical protein
MQITPPFGYREIVPLQKTQAVQLPAPGKVPEFCASTNAMPISFSEFRVAAHDYPLVFASGDTGQTFAAVAVVGLANGENLFARDGAWVPDLYVPAYVRRYPFCMARVTLEKKEQSNRLICVEKDYIAESGEKLFDAKGEPGEKWQNIERLLREYEADLERTREMCAILADYALLEPFTLQATEANGVPVNLSGMYRVKEEKLEHLNAAQHKNLFKKGITGRVYAHLLSLDNFGRLIALRNKLKPAAAAPAPAPKAAAAGKKG